MTSSSIHNKGRGTETGAMMTRRNKALMLLIHAGLLVLLPAPGMAQGNAVQHTDKHTRQTSANDDEGYFSGNTNAMILWPGDPAAALDEKHYNFVRKYRPNEDQRLSYRLWLTADYGGGSAGFPVNLKTRDGFDGFLNHINNTPGKAACVWVDDPWHDYRPVGPSARCAGNQVLEREARCDSSAGTCSDIDPDSGLTVNCAYTRPDTRCVDNPDPDPAPKPACPVTAWAPARNTVCSDRNVAQTRTLADCSTERRTVSGTRSCSRICPLSAWSPARSTVCSGDKVTQTRTLRDCSIERRTVSGARSCPRICPLSAWSPAGSTVCSGDRVTQTRTLRDCSIERRTVSGARSCPRSCPVSAWSPAGNTVCSGERLTQTRTLRDCSTESRTINGARSCPRSCPVSAWSPTGNTVCSGKRLTQTRTLADCSIESRTVNGAKSCPTGDRKRMVTRTFCCSSKTLRHCNRQFVSPAAYSSCRFIRSSSGNAWLNGLGAFVGQGCHSITAECTPLK